MITPDNIILCGFMGTGKTTVGKIVAARLGWRFFDTDQLIERKQGRTITAIFAEQGEAAFRKMESETAASLHFLRRMVIATGGGIVLDADNRHALQLAGLVVCLDAPVEAIMARLAEQTDRPLLATPDRAARITELLAVRAPVYATIEHHINTANRTPEQIAQEILMLRASKQAIAGSVSVPNPKQ